VIEPIPSSLDAAVSAAPARLFALPTYTALLELRTLLANRGLAADFWA
jgi:lipid II isoglutaminyl synthase (glutamine-hydrolysing)